MIMAIMSLTLVPNVATASTTDPVTTASNNGTKDAARAEVLMNRLKEIKEMDKSSLTRTEKRALRKEVRAIRSELAATGNGIYLSIGAIIIIILLLILLL